MATADSVLEFMLTRGWRSVDAPPKSQDTGGRRGDAYIGELADGKLFLHNGDQWQLLLLGVVADPERWENSGESLFQEIIEGNPIVAMSAHRHDAANAGGDDLRPLTVRITGGLHVGLRPEDGDSDTNYVDPATGDLFSVWA